MSRLNFSCATLSLGEKALFKGSLHLVSEIYPGGHSHGYQINIAPLGPVQEFAIQTGAGTYENSVLLHLLPATDHGRAISSRY